MAAESADAEVICEFMEPRPPLPEAWPGGEYVFVGTYPTLREALRAAEKKA
jgi:hypothetical protein